MIHSDRYIFVLNIEAQPVEETHVNVGDPDKRQPGNQVAAPSRKQHFEPKYPKGQRCDVVCETILAREQVKEFPFRSGARLLALLLAELAGLAKDLFVRHGPGHARHWKRKQKQHCRLVQEGDGKVFDHRVHRPEPIGLPCEMQVPS